MARQVFDIQFHQRGLWATFGPRSPLDQAMERAAGSIRDRAKQNLTDAGLIDTGLLRQSIQYRLVKATDSEIIYAIGTMVPYGIYHEVGTGPWIYPKRAKVLRFKPKGSHVYVFAKRVRGVQATRYLERSLKATTAQDFLV